MDLVALVEFLRLALAPTFTTLQFRKTIGCTLQPENICSYKNFIKKEIEYCYSAVSTIVGTEFMGIGRQEIPVFEKTRGWNNSQYFYISDPKFYVFNVESI